MQLVSRQGHCMVTAIAIGSGRPRQKYCLRIKAVLQGWMVPSLRSECNTFVCITQSMTGNYRYICSAEKAALAKYHKERGYRQSDEAVARFKRCVLYSSSVHLSPLSKDLPGQTCPDKQLVRTSGRFVLTLCALRAPLLSLNRASRLAVP